MADGGARIAQRNKLEKLNVGPGWEGAIDVLTSPLAGGGDGSGDSYSPIRALSDDQVLTLSKRTSGIMDSSVNGLKALSDLMLSHDSAACGEMDTGSVSWLVKHLAENMEGARSLHSWALVELIHRGYDHDGCPIDGVRRQ